MWFFLGGRRFFVLFCLIQVLGGVCIFFFLEWVGGCFWYFLLQIFLVQLVELVIFLVRVFFVVKDDLEIIDFLLCLSGFVQYVVIVIVEGIREDGTNRIFFLEGRFMVFKLENKQFLQEGLVFFFFSLVIISSFLFFREVVCIQGYYQQEIFDLCKL